MTRQQIIGAFLSLMLGLYSCTDQPAAEDDVVESAASAESAVNVTLDWSCSDGADLGPAVAAASEASLIELAGEAEDMECAIASYTALIRALHQDSSSVLVMPVGLYEGRRVNQKLISGAPVEEAAVTVYGVWQRSPAFGDLLEMAREESLPIAGSLVRYHAAGKALYADELVGRHPTHQGDIERLLGGRGRLRDQSPESRAAASELIATLLMEEDDPWQRQYLSNYQAFIGLESLRAGGLDQSRFEEIERVTNLPFLEEAMPFGGRLIYWSGRGDLETPLSPESVFIRVEYRS